MRTTARLLPVVLLCAAVAACSGSGDDTSSADGGTKTVTVLDYWADDPAKGTFDTFLAGCTQRTGYEFKRLTVAQSELITKASQLTASGDGPAMIVSDNNQVPTLAQAGVLAPFDLGKTGLKAEDFLEGPFQAATYEGTQYGLPVGNNGEVIVYNTKMLAAAGVQPPRTWSELRAAAKKLTKGDVHGWAVTMGTGETNTWNFLSQLWSNGGSLANLTAPEAVQAAEFWTSFIKEGSAPKASLKWESTDIEAQFVNGKLGIAQIGTWMLPSLAKDAKAKGIEYEQMQQVTPDGKSLITPFGGEVFTVGVGAKGGASDAVAQCIGSWNDETTLVKNAAALGYVPSYKPVTEAFLKDNPDFATLAEQLETSRSRTTEVGAAYNAYSAALAASLQQMALGTRDAASAMSAAQDAGKKAQ